MRTTSPIKFDFFVKKKNISTINIDEADDRKIIVTNVSIILLTILSNLINESYIKLCIV